MGFGCIVGGMNVRRGRMDKKCCFTLRFNKCAIWWTELLVMSQYDRKGRVLGGSLIIERMSTTACFK